MAGFFCYLCTFLLLYRVWGGQRPLPWEIEALPRSGYVALMAFAAQTALVTLALAMALLCMASGNLHGDPCL
jgi:hypothetical protein